MPTPGPNDIKAAFILEDKAAATLNQIDKELDKTTAAAKDKGQKVTKVFDGWNFALNLAVKGLKALFQVLSQNQDFQDFTAAFKEFTANQVNFSWLRDFTKQLDESNAEEKLQKLIDRRNELAVAMTMKNADGNFVASDAERAAIKKQMESIQDQVEIVGNAVRTFKKLSIETKTNDPAGWFQTWLYGEGATDIKTETKYLIKFGDAIDIAKFKQLAWKKSLEFLDKDILTVDEALKDFAEDAKRASVEVEDTFSTGFSNALKDLEKEFLSAAAFADRFAKETANTLSTNLFDAVTGKAVSAMGVLRSLLFSVTRQFTDAASAGFLGIFGGLFKGGGAASTGGGFAEGWTGYGVGAAASSGDIPRYASGGTVTRPTLAVIGEGGQAEDIVPHSQRSAYARAHGGGGQTINVTVNLNALDTRTAAAHLRTPEGKRAIGDAIIEAATTRMDVRRALA